MLLKDLFNFIFYIEYESLCTMNILQRWLIRCLLLWSESIIIYFRYRIHAMLMAAAGFQIVDVRTKTRPDEDLSKSLEQNLVLTN
jgi:hypothetical protein